MQSRFRENSFSATAFTNERTETGSERGTAEPHSTFHPVVRGPKLLNGDPLMPKDVEYEMIREAHAKRSARRLEGA
jgi:hypothetical protein